MRVGRSNTILYCDRWKETVSFYRDVFHLPVRMEKGWFVEFELHEHTFLSVAHTAHASVSSAGGAGMTLSWRVENLDTVYDRIIEAGVKPTPIQETWGARTFFLFDPEGHRIELWS